MANWAPLANPLLEQLNLGFGQRFAEFRRRHANVRVLAEHSTDHFAGVGIARLNGGMAGFQNRCGCGAFIEAQPRLTMATVRSVAGKAPIGQDWSNDFVEVNCLGTQGRVDAGQTDKGHADHQTRKIHFTTDC